MYDQVNKKQQLMIIIYLSVSLASSLMICGWLTNDMSPAMTSSYDSKDNGLL